MTVRCVALCPADERAVAAAGGTQDPAPLVVLRAPAVAAVLERQDAIAAGARPPRMVIATMRAWVRSRALVRRAGPGARIVRPDPGGLGAAIGAAVPEPRELTRGEARLLEDIGSALAGTPTPPPVRRAVVVGAVLHALYSVPAGDREDEMLDAATAQAAVAATVSVLLGHGYGFETDGTPMLRDPRADSGASARLDALTTPALLRLLLPRGRKP